MTLTRNYNYIFRITLILYSEKQCARIVRIIIIHEAMFWLIHFKLVQEIEILYIYINANNNCYTESTTFTSSLFKIIEITHI